MTVWAFRPRPLSTQSVITRNDSHPLAVIFCQQSTCTPFREGAETTKNVHACTTRPFFYEQACRHPARPLYKTVWVWMTHTNEQEGSLLPTTIRHDYTSVGDVLARECRGKQDGEWAGFNGPVENMAIVAPAIAHYLLHPIHAVAHPHSLWK
jgi:hypothetical protein